MDFLIIPSLWVGEGVSVYENSVYNGITKASLA